MLIKKICQALENAGIEYAIVGGYAVALHGATRGTIDLDLIVRHKEETFISVEKVFLDIGFKSKLPVSGSEVFNFKSEYIKNRNLIAWSFYNPQNPSEIVDVIITEDLKAKKVIKKDIGDITVRILGKQDLIKMKSKTKREQDRADIDALRSLK